jgi:hypothetical protein
VAAAAASSSSSSVAHLMTMCDVEWVVQQRRNGPDAGTESSGGRAAAAAAAAATVVVASWRLPCATVYARCPGLRPIISEFAANKADGGASRVSGRAVLRLSFSGSATALAAVVGYIHTGVLALPTPFDDLEHCAVVDVDADVDALAGQRSDLAVDAGSSSGPLPVLLELVKTAGELGMEAFKTEALEAVLLSLTDVNVDEAELFCRARGGLHDMIEVCRVFRARSTRSADVAARGTHSSASASAAAAALAGKPKSGGIYVRLRQNAGGDGE